MGAEPSERTTFSEALQICFRCHRYAPFCFYNGNTFAAIARDIVSDDSATLSDDKAYILRSVAGHIVAGTATDIEMKQLEKILAELGK
jgi:hypothetical protein